jgi:hypothetical protein
MIGAHIALMGRRRYRGYSGKMVGTLLAIRGVGLLAILYIVVVGGMMGQHFEHKAQDISQLIIDQIHRGVYENPCLERAEADAWSDAMSFNVVRQIKHWNKNYVESCEGK